MKIADLKKNDKIYCIKTFIDSKIDQVKTNDKRKKFLNGRYPSQLTPDEKQIFFSFKTFLEYQNYERLIKNKTYIVTSKIGDELTISSESNDDITIYKYPILNIFGNVIKKQYEDFLDEYFISEIQARKLKLEKIQNDDFSDFLKKLKK